MNYTATQKYVQMTPRKLRLVADSVRKLTPAAAIEILPYSKRIAAEPLVKVIKTAVANAKLAGVDEGRLVFSEIQISQGPALKRGIPVSRGQWHPIKKRMSHIRVIVTEAAVKPVVEKKTAKKSEAVVEPVAKKVTKKAVTK